MEHNASPREHYTPSRDAMRKRLVEVDAFRLLAALTGEEIRWAEEGLELLDRVTRRGRRGRSSGA